MPTPTLPITTRNAALAEIDGIFDPLINQVALFVGRLEAAGQDPARYFDVEENQTIDYTKILAERQEAKATAVKRVNDEFDRMNAAEEPEPEAGESDSTFWKAVIVIVQQVLKDGVRIRIGEFQWDSKKPLHGVGSALSDLKDSVLKAMGVEPGSEWARVLNNPGRTLGDLPENTVREVERALENSRREVDKALANATREAGKVVGNVKREADRAATNVARELGKVAPKIRIRKPRIKW